MEHVEREYGEAVGAVKRGLDGREIETFWRAAREGSGVMIGG
jgi:hypothetical protein